MGKLITLLASLPLWCAIANAQAPADGPRAAYDNFDRVGRSSEYGRIVTDRNSH